MKQADPPLLVAIGEVLWDVFPDGERLGGAPANFAVHAAGVGAQSALISCVGNDARGLEALARLVARGVDTQAVRLDRERMTGTVAVRLVDGQPEYDIVEGVAWDAIVWDQNMIRLARAAKAICFGTLAQRSVTSRKTVQRFLDAASPDCLRVLDVNFRQHYHNADVVTQSLLRANVLKLSDEEVHLLYDYVGGGPGDEATFLSDVRARFDLACVVLTKGDRGCQVFGPAQTFEVKGHRQQVVNAVGAGDAFTAVFVSHLLNGDELQVCAQAAHAAGAFVVTHDSATPELPDSFAIWL